MDVFFKLYKTVQRRAKCGVKEYILCIDDLKTVSNSVRGISEVFSGKIDKILEALPL